MLDSAGDFFYKRLLTNRRGVFRDAPRFPRLGDAQVAQLVEQRTENPRVGGSIPPLGTIIFNDLFENNGYAFPVG